GARSPWDVEGFAYYFMEQLQAVRSGPWKLDLPLEQKYTTLGRKTAPAQLALHDVRHDPGETREVSAEHPEVVARLLKLAENIRGELGDMDQTALGQRPAGLVEQPTPRTLLKK
ncbi:MAG: arylsulfatase, partial [Isosphaeraceae bacterium]